MKKIIVSTALSCILVNAGGDIAPVEPVVETAPMATSTWQHSISIYGWLPTLDGTLKYNIPSDGAPDEEVESNAIDNLDMVLMGSYEARKDKWSFLADMIYLKMSDSQEVYLPELDTTVGSEQELTGWLNSFYGGYNIVDTNKMTLDVIAGMRYFSLDYDVSLAINSNDVSISPSVEFYDALIGFKGAYSINENWYIPYTFDIGGGDSDLTWQASTSLGYRFDWGDMLLEYRHIHYDKSNGLIKDFDLYGPKLGVVFHF
jgi:hypothetical protein